MRRRRHEEGGGVGNEEGSDRTRADATAVGADGKERPSGDAAVSGLSAVLETMRGRYEILPLLIAGTVRTVASADAEQTPESASQVSLDMKALIAKLGQPPEMDDIPLKADLAEELEPLITEELRKNPIFEAVIAKYGYIDNTFKTIPMWKPFVEDLQKFFQYIGDRQRLHDMLDGRARSGKPLPFEAKLVASVEPFSYFPLVEARVAMTKTQDELKTMDDTINAAKDLALTLLEYIKRGADEVRLLVERADRRNQQAALATKKREDGKAVAAAKKKAAAMEKAEQAAQKASAPTIFSMKHRCILEVTTYDNFETFAEARAQKKHDPSVPHIIKSMPAVGAVATDRALKAALGIFRIQYPGSDLGKQGRGQQPYTGTNAHKMREALLEGASDSHAIPESWQDKPPGRVFTAVHFFGTTAGAPPVASLERQGLASCRYQESGAREMIMIDVPSLVEYAGTVGLTKKEKEIYMEYVARVLGDIVLEEQLDMFEKISCMHHATLRAGEYMYIPLGFVVMERTLGDVNSYGYRTASLEKTEKTVAKFREMKQQLEATVTPEDALVRFWTTVLEVL